MGCQYQTDFNDDPHFKIKIIQDGSLSVKPQQFIFKYYLPIEYPKIDTIKLNNTDTIIQGKVPYPIKATISEINSHIILPFILCNDSITIYLNNTINNSIIQNSPINNEWITLKSNSIKHYKNIWFLYPKMQRARIENNSKQLTEIETSIDSIKKVYKHTLLNYLKQNPKSDLSAIILNDLYNNYPQDSIILKTLSNDIKPYLKPSLNHNLW